tara:strand:+ start:1233 stop:1520 length:288 start_codon:yes stop_codon:yes gene_type:complete
LSFWDDYDDIVRVYIFWSPGILIAVFSMLLIRWRCNTLSKTKSCLIGAASGVVGSLIWPMGWIIKNFNFAGFRFNKTLSKINKFWSCFGISFYIF